MTVAVCHVMPALDVTPRHARTAPMPQQLDMWSAIQTQVDDGATKPAPTPVPAKASYPTTVRRSMSNESLDLCTESLGSETGTRGDFLDQAAVMACLYQTTVDDASAAILPPPAALHEEEEHDVQEDEESAEGELTEVRYHRARPQRAFPPPLASMSRCRGDDEGPCLRMRPHRRDGRLVVEAVAARPQGYLHARRQDGRLRLCFVDCNSARGDHQKQSAMAQQVQVQQPQQEEVVEEEEHDEVEEEEEEEEDEVEVVDRGTVVEVVAASGKAQRCSRIVINKFVGGAPDVCPSRCSRAAASEDGAPPPAPGLRRVPSSTTTLAAAVAAASTGMDEADEEEENDEADNGGQAEEKQSATTTMLFTSRVGDRAELVQSVRRCRQLRQRPLFIVEPYTIIAIN